MPRWIDSEHVLAAQHRSQCCPLQLLAVSSAKTQLQSWGHCNVTLTATRSVAGSKKTQVTSYDLSQNPPPLPSPPLYFVHTTCAFCGAASQGYGLESVDGLEDPDGSGNFLKAAELSEGFETLGSSSAAGFAAGEEEELLSDGVGMTNQEYGKARQQERMSQQYQVSQPQSVYSGVFFVLLGVHMILCYH